MIRKLLPLVRTEYQGMAGSIRPYLFGRGPPSFLGKSKRQ